MHFLSLFFSFALLPQAHAKLNIEPLAELIRDRSCLGEFVQATKGDVLVVVGLGSFGYDDSPRNVGSELVQRMAKGVNSQSHHLKETWLKYIAKDEEDAVRFMKLTSASSPIRDGLKIHYRVGGSFSVPPAKAGGEKLIFLRPHYDLNEAGHFVGELATKAQLHPAQLVVIVNDHRLEPNQIALGWGPPSGTQDENLGLKSIDRFLGTDQYLRIRVGVGETLSPEDRNYLYSLRQVSGLLMLVQKLQQQLAADNEQILARLKERTQLVLDELNR